MLLQASNRVQTESSHVFLVLRSISHGSWIVACCIGLVLLRVFPRFQVWEVQSEYLISVASCHACFSSTSSHALLSSSGGMPFSVQPIVRVFYGALSFSC